MKTRTKMVALVEVAILLCSVFLVALPAIAAAASDIYEPGPLDVFGNANEDDTIDMRDTTYIKLVIFGKKPKTELADANYDGKVSMLDVGQTKLIILGKEKKLTIVDGSNLGFPGSERIVTVDKPVERIIPFLDYHADAVQALNAEDRAVGVGYRIPEQYYLYPVMSKLPCIGEWNIDYEMIATSIPDIMFVPLWTSKWFPEMEDKLELIGVQTLYFAFHDPVELVKDFKMLGYILDRREEAGEFIDFYEGNMNIIKDRVEKLSEDEKPRVYIEAGRKAYVASCKGSGEGQVCWMAGGINIAHDLGAESVEVDREWVLEQNPDIIIAQTSYRGENSAAGYHIDDPTIIIALREEMMNRPGWENLKAVKNGNVYIVTMGLTNDPGEIIVLTAYFAKWFHPELFEELDPEESHQEYIDRFRRIDYDLDKHGVFVYPPIEINGGLAGIPDKYKG